MLRSLVYVLAMIGAVYYFSRHNLRYALYGGVVLWAPDVALSVALCVALAGVVLGDEMRLILLIVASLLPVVLAWLLCIGVVVAAVALLLRVGNHANQRSETRAGGSGARK